MDTQQSLLLKKYLDIFDRWKFLVVIILIISLPAGLIYYIKSPKVYMASSLLSYQQQKVSPNKMSPDVQARVEDIVSTLSQIVTSRTNLETVIKRYGLYEEALQKLPMEDVIELMRKQISIQPSRRGDIFSIEFSGSDPDDVLKVTNALASKFIEENIKYREERATETSAYTTNELEMAKITMDKKESAMRDYKLKYYNEMPEQRQTNVSRLISLQEQYQGKQESILELERTRVLVQEQISARKKILSVQSAELEAEWARAASAKRKAAAVSAKVSDLEKLQNRLESLLVKYTDNHPEIKRVRKLIAKLEAEGGAGRTKGYSYGRRKVNLAATDEDLISLQTQLKEISLKLQAIEQEKIQLDEKIKKYERWVAAAPVREAEWSSLTREYNQLKSHYEYLVAQDLQAKSMLNLERRQKGSQFKIEDPARFPEKPVKPDFLKIMGIFVGGAIAASCCFIIAISSLDTSFRDPDEIEHYLGVPVVSTVAYIQTQSEARKHILLRYCSTIVIGVAFIAVAALFWWAWGNGKIAI